MANETDTPDLEYSEVTQEPQAPEPQQTQPAAQSGTGGGGAPAPSGGAKPTDDMAAAMRELAESVKATRQATPAAPERQPTQQEIDQFWGIWNPTATDPQWFQKFLRLAPDMDPNEVKAIIEQFQPLFGQMQTGLVRQAVIGAKNLMDQELRKLREEYGPIQSYIADQRSQAIRNRFFTQYPSLSEPKYERIVSAAARELGPQTFANEGEFFKALAESAAGSIKGLIPDFDLGAKPQQSTGKSPRLPRSGVGGTGGAGSSHQGANGQPTKGGDDSDSLWE